ncbi:hypothetical protein CYMTET_39550 [Cymbomonas tetramitiformis]|uniref:Ubiquitin-like protease family profile domain-containing protein n=1 Tax=Cymbomonas tetramitiformis TaxID=36881 RepID=A0AAE0F4D5_9CHLO|nr:hypothetical protein CYMTET_39550 [Cymbomonas tetramitiformis]
MEVSYLDWKRVNGEIQFDTVTKWGRRVFMKEPSENGEDDIIMEYHVVDIANTEAAEQAFSQLGNFAGMLRKMEARFGLFFLYCTIDYHNAQITSRLEERGMQPSPCASHMSAFVGKHVDPPEEDDSDGNDDSIVGDMFADDTSEAPGEVGVAHEVLSVDEVESEDADSRGARSDIEEELMDEMEFEAAGAREAPGEAQEVRQDPRVAEANFDANSSNDADTLNYARQHGKPLCVLSYFMAGIVPGIHGAGVDWAMAARQLQRGESMNGLKVKHPMLDGNGTWKRGQWRQMVLNGFKSHDVIGIPIHLHFHWVLGVFYPKNISVELFDSSEDAYRNIVLINILKEIFCIAYNYDGNMHQAVHRDINVEHVSDQVGRSNTQANGVDCGVFMLMNMNAVANQLPVGDVVQSLMMGKRLQMATDLRVKLENE